MVIQEEKGGRERDGRTAEGQKREEEADGGLGRRKKRRRRRRRKDEQEILMPHTKHRTVMGVA